MTLYGAIVFLHVAAILVFFIAHGVSMAVAFRLRVERDPVRVRTLLDLSGWAMGIPAITGISVGLIAGIAAGIMGGWLGDLWFWISLVLLVVVALAMTPMAASRLKPIRAAAGTGPINPFSRVQAPAPEAHPAELSRLLDAWNPIPAAALGAGSFFVILWLMMFKPF